MIAKTEDRELYRQVTTRRELLRSGAAGIGSWRHFHAGTGCTCRAGEERRLHLLRKAKRIIFLFMNGAPSQQDLFDYKPAVDKKYHG